METGVRTLQSDLGRERERKSGATQRALSLSFQSDDDDARAPRGLGENAALSRAQLGMSSRKRGHARVTRSSGSCSVRSSSAFWSGSFRSHLPVSRCISIYISIYLDILPTYSRQVYVGLVQNILASYTRLERAKENSEYDTLSKPKLGILKKDTRYIYVGRWLPLQEREHHRDARALAVA